VYRRRLNKAQLLTINQTLKLMRRDECLRTLLTKALIYPVRNLAFLSKSFGISNGVYLLEEHDILLQKLP